MVKDKPTDSSLSLLTYNIQAGIGTEKTHHYLTRAHNQLISTKAKQDRLRDIGKLVASFDLVCLQEVDLGGRRAGFQNQAEIIREASGHPHLVVQENRTIRNISRHGNAILSRSEILSIEDLKLPGSMTGRGALVVELDMDPATLLICAHLSLGLNDQMQQLKFIGETIDLTKRVILCGDLNCSSSSVPVTSFGQQTTIQPTTSMQHKSYPSWAPRVGIDHILSNRPTHISEVRVEPEILSDHRAVSAKISPARL